MSYDQAGNVVGYASTPNPYMHYDAAGKLFTQFESSGGPGIVRVRENFYDGDGAKILHKTSNGSMINGNYDHFCNYYLIRSSVLGGRVIAEFKDLTTLPANDPLKYSSMSYVYLQGVQLAFQQGAHQTTGDKHVVWTYHNPTVGNYFAEYQLNNSSQQQQNFLYGEMTFDPLGSYVGLTEQQPLNIPEPFTFSMGQFIDSNTGKCYADYVETSCTIVQAALNNRWGVQAPWGSMAVGMNRFSTSDSSFDFTVNWDTGFYGFVPSGGAATGLIIRVMNGSVWDSTFQSIDQTLQAVTHRKPKIDKLGGLDEAVYSRAYSLLFTFVNDDNCVQVIKDNTGSDLVYMLTSRESFVRLGGLQGVLNNRSRVDLDRILINSMGLNADGVNHVNAGMRLSYGNGTYPDLNAWTIGRQEHRVQGSRPSILLNESAYNNGNLHLAYTLLHELLHVAGWQSNGNKVPRMQKIRYFVNSYLGGNLSFYPGEKYHDLTNVPGYDDILNTCTRGMR